MEMTEDSDIQAIRMKAELDRGCLQTKGDIKVEEREGKFEEDKRHIFEGDIKRKFMLVLVSGLKPDMHFFPSFSGKESITVYSCDCSIEALKRAEEVIDAAVLVLEKHSFHPFPCDFSISGFLKRLSYDPCREVILPKQDICLSDVEDKRVAGNVNAALVGVDFVTLIFMLLALPLHRMPTAIAACFAVLKPGGLLLFRDYVLYLELVEIIKSVMKTLAFMT
ncbi:hypothetical protein ACSBR2_007096 [Camellia fascicularis]